MKPHKPTIKAAIDVLTVGKGGPQLEAAVRFLTALFDAAAATLKPPEGATPNAKGDE